MLHSKVPISVGRLHPMRRVAVELHGAVAGRNLRVPAVVRRHATHAAAADPLVDVGGKAQPGRQDARGKLTRGVAPHQAVGFVPAGEQVHTPILAAPFELRRQRPVVDAVDVVAGACPQVADLVRTRFAEVALSAFALVHVGGEPERQVLAESRDVHRTRVGHPETAVVSATELSDDLAARLPLGPLAHVVDRAADAVAPVDRVLRPAQHLDPFDVEAVGVDSRRPTGKRREPRLIDRHRRLAQVEGAERRADPAHGEHVVVGVGGRLQARRHQGEIVDVFDLQLLDLQRIERGDREGHGHLRLLALLRRDDHLLDDRPPIRVVLRTDSPGHHN